MSPLKVFIVGYDGLIASMYIKQGGFEIVTDPAEANIIQFTGGADVSPELYDDAPHPTTGNVKSRDLAERSVWMKTRQVKQIKVGICRGAQFLCVMNGGALWQDVDHHAIAGTHSCLYIDENNLVRDVEVTSTHHQMMLPSREFERWGAVYLSSYRDRGDDRRAKSNFVDEGPDNEVIFWPKTMSLGFQPHPEYGSKSCRELFFECLGRVTRRWEHYRGLELSYRA